MKDRRPVILAGAAYLALAMGSSCVYHELTRDKSSTYATGEVDEKRIDSEGRFSLVVEAEGRRYTMEIDDMLACGGSPGSKTPMGLVAVLEKGDHISFPLKYDGHTLFDENNTGKVDPDTVNLIK